MCAGDLKNAFNKMIIRLQAKKYGSTEKSEE